MPPLYVIQWGIVGFFVIIHFLFGFIRGGSKSTYFSIVSIILTFVTLWLVSKISLNLIFSMFMSLDTMISTITGLVGVSIPAEFMDYILDPGLTAFAVAVVDIVLRIVAFIVIYPILKWSLTMTIFRPIWKHGIKKALLKKQNEKAKQAFEIKHNQQQKYKNSKKLNKPITGRVMGAFMGAIRGFVVGFVVLLPVIVISGFVSGINDILVFHQDQTVTLGSNTSEVIAIPNEIQQYIDQIVEMNQKGVGAITKDIVINGKTADRLLFDMIFTTDIVVEGEKLGEISLGQELEGIIGIAEIIINGGYLEDSFDYMTISSDNLDDIEGIFGYISQSSLLKSMIPIGTKFAVKTILPDLIDGTDLYENETTAAALNQFTAIDWSDEFMNLYGIIEAVLEFGSVEELMSYADDPNSILEITPDQASAFTDIIRAFGNLETLYVLNAAIDFATSLDQVTDMITWVDPSEREAYLKDRLSFILDNPDFFVGEDGEISRIANFVEAIFGDEDVNIRELVESLDDLETFIALQDPEWIGNLLDELVEIQLLTQTLPLGVDFALYNAFGTEIEADLADRIAQALESTEWDQEILNVGSIYQEVLKLGIEAVLGDNPNYYAFIDDVAVNHMDSIRVIVSHIFEDSQVVNAAIEQASPYLIDRFIDDQELKTLVEQALMSDPVSEVVDFNFGTEINNILTMVESIYSFTTTEELTSISSMTTAAQLNLISSFGSMTQVEFDAFDSAIKNMQLFDRIGKAGLEYVQSTQAIDQLYIPEEVSLGEDLSSILNFAYYASNFVYTESLTTPIIEDIDFAPLFADETFRSYLLPSDENHSELLVSNIAHNLMYYASDETISQYLVIPDSLLVLSPEDAMWGEEINHLFGAVFDLAASFEDSDALTLSIREILTLADDPMQANIELITQFADDTMTKADEAFGGLDQSLIFRHSISQAIETVGTSSLSFIEGYELSFPDIAKDAEGIILEDMFVELIWGISTLLEDANQTLGFETFADLTANQDNYLYVTALNNIEDTTFESFAGITILRGIISDLLLNQQVQSYVRDTVRNTGIVDVSDQFFAFERAENVLSVSDIAELFISAKSLQVTSAFYYDPAGQIYGFLDTLSEVQLDTFFDATILKEIFTFILADELIVESLGVKVNEIYYNAQAGSSFLAAINPDFTNFISSLGAIRDVDGYFDLNEIKSLIYAFNELDIRSEADLSALADLTLANAKIENTLVIDKLFESEWISQHINYIFLDENLYTDLAAIASDQIFKQTGISHTLTKDDVSFVLPKYEMLETVGENAGKIKVSEFKEFLVAATRVNWIGEEVSAATIANLLLAEGTDGLRNIDVMTESNLIVAIFDKLLNFEYNGFGADQILADFANTKLGANPTFDGLTFTKELLHFDQTAYDANEVLKASEIVSLVESFSLIDLSQTINLETFITIVDNGQLPDLLSSKIIHSIISNALTDMGVQSFGVNKVNAIQTIMVLPDDFFSVDEDVLMDGDLFKVNELENIFIALRALGLTDSASFSSLGMETFIGLVDPETEDEFGDDNLDRVLNANYIYILLERALNLEDIGVYAGDLLGLNEEGQPPLDLTPPDSIKVNDPLNVVENERLPKEEFRRLLTSISMMGDFTALSDPSVVIDLMTGMVGAEVDPITNEDEFDRFLSSDYLYYLISVILENQDALTIPLQAYQDGGVYDGFIKKVEIRSVLDVLLILEVSGPNDIDPALITVADLEEIILSSDSALVNYLLSQAIIDALDPNGEGLIPDDAYEGLPEDGLLSNEEIEAILDALIILADGDKSIGILDIDFEAITVGQVDELSTVPSVVIKQRVADEIKKALDPDNLGKIPADAYEDGNTDGRLTQDEMDALIVALYVLAEDEPNTLINEISYDITVAKVLQLRDGTGTPGEVLGVDSLIIQQLISDEVITLLGAENVPDDAYTDLAQTRLTQAEIIHMIGAIEILNTTDPSTTLVQDLYVDGTTVDQVAELNALPSLITKTLITNQIVEQLDPDEEGKIPPEAYSLEYPNILSDDELDAMIAALYVLANDNGSLPVTDISTDVTVAQAAKLKDGTGTPGEILGIDSYIIQQLVSDEVVTIIGIENIPDASYIDVEKSRLTQAEIINMIEAIEILNTTDPNTTLVQSLDVDGTTVDQVAELNALPSLITKTLITNQIVEQLDPDDEGKIPPEAYSIENPTILSDDELDAMIVALYVLAYDNGSLPVTDISTDVTVAQAAKLKDGNGVPGEILGIDSYIIQQLVSDEVVTIIGTENIPDDSYIDPEKSRLTQAEIVNMIEAIEILDTSIDGSTLVQNLNVNDVTVDQVSELNDLPSQITKKLISNQIIDQLDPDDEGKIPVEAYDLADPTRLSDDELDAMIVALYVLADDDGTTMVRLIDTDVTVAQASKLKDGNGVPGEILGIDSYTIQQLVSDEVVTVIGAANIPDDSYIDPEKSRLKKTEIISMIDAIEILNTTDPNTTLVQNVSTSDVTVDQVSDLNALPSAITKKIISDQIIDVLDPNDEGKIPVEGYDLTDPTRLSDDELDAIVVALYVLANQDGTTKVSAINTDVTVAQTTTLKDGTGTPGEIKGIDSYAIQQTVSDEIIVVLGTANIPDSSYVNPLDPANSRLLKSEIESMIDAIEILNTEDPNITLVANVSTTNVTVGQTQELNALPSLITKKVISNSIIDAIDPLDEGKIPLAAYDLVDPTRLSDDEITKMLTALEVLAEGNLNTVVTDIDTDLITIGQVDDLSTLGSIIMDKTISDAIVDSIDPLGEGKIPATAYIDDNPLNNLEPAEVAEMINALRILVDDNDPLTDPDDELVSSVDTTTIRIGQVSQMNALNSEITKKLISDSIIDAIDPNDEGKIPDAAYIDGNSAYNLTPAEVTEMIEALRILAGKEAGDPDSTTDLVVVSDITVDPTIYQVSAMNALDSEITEKLISDSIVDAIDPDDEGKIPDAAYIDDNPANNLEPAEVLEMIEALRILAGKEAGDPNSTTDPQVVSLITVDPTIYQVSAMHALNSEITKKLISDSIIEAIDPLDEGKIPLSAHIDGIATNNLRPDEVTEMIEALRILAGKKVGDPDTLTDPQIVSLITVDPTIGQVKQLNALNSDITEKLISDSIIDAVGLANVPIDAYVADTPGNLLKASEVLEMIDALEILGADNDPLTDIDDKQLDEIDTRVTVAQTQDLKVNDSVIIKQIISNAIVDMLAVDQIPNDAYRTEVGLDRLTDDEIADMIDSLEILAGGDDTAYVDEIIFNEATFTVSTLKSFPDSLILNRIISSALITNMPNIPSESYVIRLIADPEYNLDLLRVEIDNLFEALTILGIEDPNNADNINATDITFAEMDQITLLGTPGSLYEHPDLVFSPIITHILSTPMVAVISDVRSGHDYGIPTTAMRNTNDLLYTEVVGLVDALKLIGNVGNGVGQEDPSATSLADITISPSGFGPTLLNNLIGLDSLVVYRMISIGIHDANIATPDSYAEDGDRNFDPGLPALPVLEDVEIDEMNHIVTSMNILSITSIANVASEITIPKLKALTGPEIETLVEAISDGPNTIIYYLISDVVDPDNDLFPTPFGDIHYVYDGPTRIRLKRASIAAALALL